MNGFHEPWARWHSVFAKCISNENSHYCLIDHFSEILEVLYLHNWTTIISVKNVPLVFRKVHASIDISRHLPVIQSNYPSSVNSSSIRYSTLRYGRQHDGFAKRLGSFAGTPTIVVNRVVDACTRETYVLFATNNSERIRLHVTRREQRTTAAAHKLVLRDIKPKSGPIPCTLRYVCRVM